MIHRRHSFIFIHIPKTGGTSVEDVLWPQDRQDAGWGYDKTLPGFLQHLTCKQIVDRGFVDESTFRHCFKFVIVRNPWDRCVSEYLWRIKKHGNFVNAKINIKEYGAPQVSADEIRNLSLLGFLNKNYPWREVSYQQHDATQCAYVMDNNARSLVDFIGRFERLQSDFDRICDAIGIPRSKLPHKKKMDRLPYWEYYDEETRKIVASKYREDIETFQYTFGE